MQPQPPFPFPQSQPHSAPATTTASAPQQQPQPPAGWAPPAAPGWGPPPAPMMQPAPAGQFGSGWTPPAPNAPPPAQGWGPPAAQPGAPGGFVNPALAALAASKAMQKSANLPRCVASYILEVTAIIGRGTSPIWCIGEFSVVASNGAPGQAEAPLTVGATGAIKEDISTAQNGGASRFNAFLSALAGEDFDSMPEAAKAARFGKFVDFGQGGPQLGVGLRVRVDTWPDTAKRKGGPVTGKRYTAIPRDAAEVARIDQVRASKGLAPLAQVWNAP